MDKHNYSSTTHKKAIQKSTTLNRRFVKKMDIAPRKVAKRGYVEPIIAKPVQAQAPQKKVAKIAAEPDAPPVAHPRVAVANARIAAVATAPRQLSAHELKERAIEKALKSAEAVTVEQDNISVKKHFWKSKKFYVALGMSLASLALLGYLVHLNLPDLSVRVAAMQTGIDGSYPSYIPRGYALQGVVSGADKKIEMTFANDDKSFTLTEEKSSWDSSALLANYVKKEWGENYTIADEQGLRIYISNGNAAWVSGGIFYLLTSGPNTTLTKQQIHDTAVSL